MCSKTGAAAYATRRVAASLKQSAPQPPPPPTQQAHQHAQRQLLRLHKVQRKVGVRQVEGSRNRGVVGLQAGHGSPQDRGGLSRQRQETCR